MRGPDDDDTWPNVAVPTLLSVIAFGFLIVGAWLEGFRK